MEKSPATPKGQQKKENSAMPEKDNKRNKKEEPVLMKNNK